MLKATAGDGKPSTSVLGVLTKERGNGNAGKQASNDGLTGPLAYGFAGGVACTCVCGLVGDSSSISKGSELFGARGP